MGPPAGSIAAGGDVEDSIAQISQAVSSLRVQEIQTAVHSFGAIVLQLIGFFQNFDITVLSVDLPWPSIFIQMYRWCAALNIPFSLPTPGKYTPIMTLALKCAMMLIVIWALLNVWTILDYSRPMQGKGRNAVVKNILQRPRQFIMTFTVCSMVPLCLCVPQWYWIDSAPEVAESAMWVLGSSSCFLGCVGVYQTIVPEEEAPPGQSWWPQWSSWDEREEADFGWVKLSVYLAPVISVGCVSALLPLAIALRSDTVRVETVKLALGGFGVVPLLYSAGWLFAILCQLIHSPREIPSEVNINEVAAWKVAHHFETSPNITILKCILWLFMQRRWIDEWFTIYEPSEDDNGTRLYPLLILLG